MKNSKTNTKRLATIGALCAAFIFSSAPPSVAAEKVSLTQQSVSDISTGAYQSIPIRLSGARRAEYTAYLINSQTYVPLRAFANDVCSPKISFDSSTRTATLSCDRLVLSATDKCNYIIANGRYLYSTTPARILSDSTMYIPVRPLAKALGLSVNWDAAARSVTIGGTYSPIESGDSYYDADEVYWLSRIISAESRGEPLLGQIAVGNVVLNRVASRSYPNSIYGVIFDRTGGTQFSPVSLGTVYASPYYLSVIAAKICLEGFSISDGILFFFEPTISTSSWISRNRPYAFTIQSHWFYY